LAAFILFVLAVRSAHPAPVTGTFVEHGGRTPLAGVEVVLRAAADSTVIAHAATGADGGFRLDGVAPGRYRLRAVLLGHAPYTRAELVLGNAAARLDLGTQALAVAPLALPGVETSTERGTAIVASDRNIYLAKDIPAAGGGTTIDFLRAVPELDVDINDHVSIRGSSSVTIQINGRTSPLKGESLTSFLRQFPAARIERVEVISNPSAKFDPEGMAGIINIVTKEPLDLGLSGSVFAFAGDHNFGGGPRLAWQKGRLILSGGASGYWNSLRYNSEDVRHNLLAQPPSTFQLRSSWRNRSGFGNGDGSFEYAFDKKSTLYGSGTGYVSSYRSDSDVDYVIGDSAQPVITRYERASRGRSQWGSNTGSVGFRHVVEQNRNEWTVEAQQTRSPSDSHSDAVQHFTVPADSAGQVSAMPGAGDTRERSLQADVVRPLGAKGKIEFGYRGADRRTSQSSRLDVLSGGTGGGVSDYVHHEVFHSGYLTVGQTVGRLSVQLGARGEAANTTFDVIPTATRYHNDYRSLFPSANAAWDFGNGKTVRVTYSKRIERPSAGYLDPGTPSSDPLNLNVGNPYLKPKYTHSVSLDASWSGSRGLVRLSPFYRRTVDNWDQYKIVDSLGVATLTWRNATSIRTWGASLMGSLRQTGRFGGTASVNVYREEHDASNVSASLRRDATNWSLNGNVTFKVLKPLDLQAWAYYRPAQTLAQGRMSASTYSTLGARLKVGKTGWVSLNANDPFKLWKYTFVTSDATHRQTSTNHGSMRRFSVSFGWSWGKPPEPKARRQAPTESQQPQGEQPVMR